MGLEAARRFSKLGNTVLMVARNRERLQAEAADLPSLSRSCEAGSTVGSPE